MFSRSENLVNHTKGMRAKNRFHGRNNAMPLRLQLTGNRQQGHNMPKALADFPSEQNSFGLHC
jgi:hypothetical protein